MNFPIKNVIIYPWNFEYLNDVSFDEFWSHICQKVVLRSFLFAIIDKKFLQKSLISYGF